MRENIYIEGRLEKMVGKGETHGEEERTDKRKKGQQGRKGKS